MFCNKHSQVIVMNDSLYFKFSDLSEEERWWLAYDALSEYTEEIIGNPYCPSFVKSYSNNKVFRKIICLLDSIGIFNKTIRHIDWKHYRRFSHAISKVRNKVEDKYHLIFKKDIYFEYTKLDTASILYMLLE